MSFLLAHAKKTQGIKTLVILQCSKGVPDLKEDDRAFVLSTWLSFPHVLWQFSEHTIARGLKIIVGKGIHSKKNESASQRSTGKSVVPLRPALF